MHLNDQSKMKCMFSGTNKTHSTGFCIRQQSSNITEWKMKIKTFLLNRTCCVAVQGRRASHYTVNAEQSLRATAISFKEMSHTSLGQLRGSNDSGRSSGDLLLNAHKQPRATLQKSPWVSRPLLRPQLLPLPKAPTHSPAPPFPRRRIS